MNRDLFVIELKNASIFVAVVLAVAVAALWAKSSVMSAKPATAATMGAGETASAPMSPHEIMRAGGKDLPVADPVEPF
jgi:hypothetical protein